MNVLKIASCAAGVTALCLAQISFEVSLVKTGYQLREKERLMQTLVDRHRQLVYNNLVMSSPQNLTEALTDNALALTQAGPRDIVYLRTALVADIPAARHSGSARRAAADFWVPAAEAASHR